MTTTEALAARSIKCPDCIAAQRRTRLVAAAEQPVDRIRAHCRNEGHPIQLGADACYCQGGPDAVS
jgi:hypothetical protein